MSSLVPLQFYILSFFIVSNSYMYVINLGQFKFLFFLVIYVLIAWTCLHNFANSLLPLISGFPILFTSIVSVVSQILQVILSTTGKRGKSHALLKIKPFNWAKE